MKSVVKEPSYPERIDFSRIKTSIPIPNLIEVQKKSYERFLQMFTAPEDREDSGLQSVFKSVFPITDFRETCSLEFLEYSVGSWECKCGRLKGIEYLKTVCRNCGRSIFVSDPKERELTCPKCGMVNINQAQSCDECGNPVALNYKYSVQECQERGMTFSVPLKVKIRLVVYEKGPDDDEKSIRDMKEQEVFFGDIPMLTQNGTFIINGTERVIVSQLHRSPGVFFTKEGNLLTAKIIPYRGSWVEFELDAKSILQVRIDRKRKFLGTIFLRALGLRSDEEIIKTFYPVLDMTMEGKKAFGRVGYGLIGHRVKGDLLHPRKKDVLVKRGKKIRMSIIEELVKAKVDKVQLDREDLLHIGKLASDVVDKESGEILYGANTIFTPEILEDMEQRNVNEWTLFFPEMHGSGPVISETLEKDSIKTTEEALLEMYRRLRPGDPPTMESSKSLFRAMFSDSQRYDFSRVGRLKFNTKLGRERSLDSRILTREDFFDVLRYMFRLSRNVGEFDDIDHLGNRRVRSVGELLENQFRIGLVRMERAIKEKMSVYAEMTTAMPHDLINSKPVMAAIQEFFGSSQLSQFMDQTNPLAEVTHKRRLSALGPGGLSRERAGFEVRDVHPTHYGRICPIETPEGPNIGLISSLSCYARINEFGFIESPYKKVEKGKVVDYFKVLSPGESNFKIGDIVNSADLDKELNRLKGRKKGLLIYEPHSFYLSAWEEDKVAIAQANAMLDARGRFVNELVNARKAGESRLVPREEVEYIDVSPKQLVSVAAALIPFLENDDANRALMGSNMQRQAVPLLRPESPFVGTGMEFITAKDSGAVSICQRAGIVDSVDSRRIIVRVAGEDGENGKGEEGEFGADIYSLTKFKRSNQNTCINQKPIVEVGQKVVKGQILADGSCTDQGELALGRNVLVAFMPWRGYNFEDAIVVSERLVKDDSFTSIHIEEFEIEARDTKLGPEEITRDIPNVSEEFLKDLDESGIIRIGAYVKPGDLLVGKVTPKGETQLTPEEKLLRAIFGEKSGDWKDASLTTPSGIEGTIVDVKIFCRKGAEKDIRAKRIELEIIERMEKNLSDEIRILQEENRNKIAELLLNEKLVNPLKEKRSRNILLEKGTKLTSDILASLSTEDLLRCEIKPHKEKKVEEIRKIEDRTEKRIQIIKKFHKEKIDQMKKGDELAPGVIKIVKVYVAMKRKLSVGDKIAGRHGNKGVIAKILPEEDTPYLPDGTPVDVILNPLGVPSRMNVGQILETHLGWAAKKLNMLFSTPVFDGATEEEIKKMLQDANLPLDGKTVLYDGKRGTPFDQRVTVGYIYLMKLSHLVDDKIHARSIGPYSLITQQPLGGKAQFGGQRFGEMEVWALEAYGAAHTLQELLTVKSDDVQGRTKAYEALVKGQNIGDPGLPESFNVLVRELQSLCLNVELLTDREE